MRLSTVIDKMVMRSESIYIHAWHRRIGSCNRSCFKCNNRGPKEPWSVNHAPRHWPHLNMSQHLPSRNTWNKKTWLSNYKYHYLLVNMHGLQLTGKHQVSPPLLPLESCGMTVARGSPFGNGMFFPSWTHLSLVKIWRNSHSNLIWLYYSIIIECWFWKNASCHWKKHFQGNWKVHAVRNL